MKTITTILLLAALIFPATAGAQPGAQSPQRKANNSFTSPIQRRITPAQFTATCISQLTPMYVMRSGTLLQISKHILNSVGPTTQSTGIAPPLREYKTAIANGDTLYLSTTGSSPIPTIVTKLPGHKKGDIITARLGDSGQTYTTTLTIDGSKKETTLALYIPWGNPPAPTSAQLLTAFKNGTPFKVVLPTGTAQLPTLYTVTLK